MIVVVRAGGGDRRSSSGLQKNNQTAPMDRGERGIFAQKLRSAAKIFGEAARPRFFPAICLEMSAIQMH